MKKLLALSLTLLTIAPVQAAGRVAKAPKAGLRVELGLKIKRAAERAAAERAAAERAAAAAAKRAARRAERAATKRKEALK